MANVAQSDCARENPPGPTGPIAGRATSVDWVQRRIVREFGNEVNLVQVDNAQLAPVWSDWSEYSQEEQASLAMVAMNRFEAQYGVADNVELAPLWANNSEAEQARLEREAIDTLEAQLKKEWVTKVTEPV
ncbi:hypothetical protein C8J56DRAFT_1030410 [Mycena floridula]|nr:hypothetical protein C8J56DRAFT_1030410 [Mycena floridula]